VELQVHLEMPGARALGMPGPPGIRLFQAGQHLPFPGQTCGRRCTSITPGTSLGCQGHPWWRPGLALWRPAAARWVHLAAPQIGEEISLRPTDFKAESTGIFRPASALLDLPGPASARSQDFQSAELLRLPTKGVDSTEPNLTTEVVSWV
jgi:hypothetical protein